MNRAQIHVNVVYATPLEADTTSLRLPAGATAEQAIRLSGVLDRHPEIDLEHGRIGIFGRWVRGDALLRDADRVEIYRPLTADPKDVRRQRARR